MHFAVDVDNSHVVFLAGYHVSTFLAAFKQELPPGAQTTPHLTPRFLVGAAHSGLSRETRTCPELRQKPKHFPLSSPPSR